MENRTDDPCQPDDDDRQADRRRAWIEEAERRMEAVRAGEMRLIDAEEVLADPRFGDADDPPPFDPAWIAEVNRRMDEVEAGVAPTISADEFFSRLEARRREQRRQVDATD